MAWQTPTLAGLIDRARKAFRAELPGSDAWIWPNNITVTAKVFAGITYELFGRLDWRMRQLFASTADGTYLERHAYELGLSRRAAAPAGGIVTFTAAAAFSLDAGALLRSTSDQDYALVSAVSLDGAGIIDAQVMAVSDGAAANLEAGAPLSIVSGLNAATAEVGAGGITGGSDAEDDESLRARILFRKRNPPHGGSAADYVSWCKEVPGVTRVFVERLWSGAGTVRVFILMDDLYEDGIPTAADIARVKAYLDMVAPAAAGLTLAAPVAYPVDIAVPSLSPDTATLREAVARELRSMLLRRGRVAGSDTGAMDYLATPFTLSRSWVTQAISDAADEASHVLAAPSVDLPIPAGAIPTLGTLAFPS